MASETNNDNLSVPPPLVEGDALSGFKNALYDDPESETTLYRVPFLNLAFAVSSLLLLLVTVWAIWQDYDREWKGYVYEWQEHLARQYNERLEREEESIREEQERLDQEIRDREEELRKMVELPKLEAESNGLRNEAEQADLRVRFFKADIQAASFAFEEAKKEILREEGGETSAARRRIEALEEDFHTKWTRELEKKEREAEVARVAADEATEAYERYREALKVARDELGLTTTQRDLLAKALDEVRASPKNAIRNWPLLDFFAPSARIQKVVLEDLTEPLNFVDTGRVDRCKSCHLNIDDPAPEFAAVTLEDKPHQGRVYRGHPRLDLYVGSSSPHPYQEFGCTICHYGDGYSLTFFTTAHTPGDPEERRDWEEKYHWHKMHHQDFPMLPMPYISATCAKCHFQESRIPGAELYNRGHKLVEEFGCYGCHKIEGFEGRRKAGPDLRNLASKVDRQFLYKWIRDPTSFRSTTRMPRFFDLENSTGSIEVIGFDSQFRIHPFEERNAVEALSLAAFVHGTASRRDDLRPLSGLQGDPARGEVVFRESGCLGCHPVESRGWTENDRGPDLGGIGSKVSRRWLADWIVDPRKHWPETRMPRLRIEQDENGEQKLSDLIEFLMTLHNRDFERIPTPEINEERRAILKDIAYDYYRRGMTRAAAVEVINAAYKPEGLDGNAPQDADLKKGDEKLLNFVGERLIGRYGCFGCHPSIQGYEDAQPIGTELSKHGNKPVDRLDFAQWGHQPNGERAMPHTRIAWFSNKLRNTRLYDMIPVRTEDSAGNPIYEPSKNRVRKSAEELLKMPLFRFHDDEEKIQALVTFLLSRREDKIPDSKKRILRGDARILEDGARLVHDFNCQGCHRIGVDVQDRVLAEAEDPATDFPRYSYDDPPEAAEMRELEKETWLARDVKFEKIWLAEEVTFGDLTIPAGTFIDGHRQKFEYEPLGEGEYTVREIAEDYWLKNPGDRRELKLADLTIPAQTFLTQTFATGDEEEYSVVEIAEEYWKGRNAPVYNRVLSVRGFGEGPVRVYFGKDAQARTKAPPILRLEGDRVHGDWLFDFLLNVQPLRPWLSIRMPSYDMTPEESSAIVGMFKVLAGTPYPHERFAEHTLDRELGRLGRQYFALPKPEEADLQPPPTRLGCQNCHPAGEKPPVNPDQAQWGPDLGLSRARLRPEWIRCWFVDPQSFMPGTNMPNFWFQFDPLGEKEDMPEEVRKVIGECLPWKRHSASEVQGGREQWQQEMEALLQYLMHMAELDRES